MIDVSSESWTPYTTLLAAQDAGYRWVISSASIWGSLIIKQSKFAVWRWLWVTAFFALPTLAVAGTAIKINHANVDFEAETLLVEGINFPTDGSLEVTIGDTFLSSCAVTASQVSCPLTGTPALAGGTWNVHLSAGNSPNSNANIDVYILTGLVSCNPGDSVTCYTGDAGDVGIGVCRAGQRTCGSDGTFGACTGETTPVDEYPDYCRDFLDNNCDGVADECKDVLVNNPSYFYPNSTYKTFTAPPGVNSLNVAVAGGGGGGSGAGSRTGTTEPFYGGSGGGSGGISVREGYELGDIRSFTVTVGAGGPGGSHGVPGRSSPRAGYGGGVSRVDLSGGTTIVSAFGGRGGDIADPGDGGLGDATGQDGGLGTLCDLGDPVPGEVRGNGYGGPGGASVPYPASDGSGEGGAGGDIYCWRNCTVTVSGLTCTYGGSSDDGIDGQPGWVKVWWDETP